MVNIHIMKYMIEIQNTMQPAGINCIEGVEVEVKDEGAGPFITMECRNLERNPYYASGSVSMNPKDVLLFCDALKTIVADLETPQ